MEGVADSAAAWLQRGGYPAPRIYNGGINDEGFFELSSYMNPIDTSSKTAINDVTREMTHRANANAKDPPKSRQREISEIRHLHQMTRGRGN